MTPDFYASYISGSIGILIGNPLDLIKVRLQSQPQQFISIPPSPPISTPIPSLSPQTTTITPYAKFIQKTTSLARGTAAPILGYGALNALLFMTYNRTSSYLDSQSFFGAPSSSLSFQRTDHSVTGTGSVNLWNIWIAGAIGGLATWIISTPTEIIKCRVQLSRPNSSSFPTSTSTSIQGGVQRTLSSYAITKSILHTSGIRGLFRGGVVTALRDSIGYGFYFWSYELTTRFFASRSGGDNENQGSQGEEAMKVLLCGGIAGVVTWGSVFPLDVIKTRVQTQFLASTACSPSLPVSPPFPASPSSLSTTSHTPLLNLRAHPTPKPLSAWRITTITYQTEGLKAFWRGFGVCCVRAFIVNAVQWATYEWIMKCLGDGLNA